MRGTCPLPLPVYLDAGSSVYASTAPEGSWRMYACPHSKKHADKLGVMSSQAEVAHEGINKAKTTWRKP